MDITNLVDCHCIRIMGRQSRALQVRVGSGSVVSTFWNPKEFFPLAGRIFTLFMALLVAQGATGAELQPRTLAAWETYVSSTERRIAAELDDGQRFLAADFLNETESNTLRALLSNGRVYIRKMETADESGQRIQVKGGMIHHWFGSIFVPDVNLDSLIQWVQNYDQHQQYFNEVEESKLLSREGPTFHLFFRLRRKKIVTVVYNTEHTAVYRQHDPRRVSSRSFTTRIAQLEDPGTPSEKEKPVGNDSGFLWRLNSYWRFQEQEGGVFVECESLSLSRGIPFLLSWIFKGYVESVPRESLQNTLTSIREGIH